MASIGIVVCGGGIEIENGPVARWQRQYSSLMMGACVPLPEPGGPVSCKELVESMRIMNPSLHTALGSQ